MAFQGLHASQAVSQDAKASQTDGPAEVIAESPDIWYAVVEKNIWNGSHAPVPPACNASTSAWTETPSLEPPPAGSPTRDPVGAFSRLLFSLHYNYTLPVSVQWQSEAEALGAQQQ